MTEHTFLSVSNKRCPMYHGDFKVKLTSQAYEVSPALPTCVILGRELSNLVIQLMSDERSLDRKQGFSCGGCTGLVKFERAPTVSDRDRKLLAYTSRLPLFKDANEGELLEFIRAFDSRAFRDREYIINENSMSPRMYIILHGAANILRAGCQISAVNTGDVIGELSFVTTSPASSSVQATTETLTLCITQDKLKALLYSNALAKTVFIKVLSDKLHFAMNSGRTSGLAGKLEEIPLSEILQLCNQSGKTGVFDIEIDRTNAQLLIRKGAIVRVDYGPVYGKDAFFLLLKNATHGWFSFTAGEVAEDLEPVGDFMSLLLEGLQHVDETE